MVVQKMCFAASVIAVVLAPCYCAGTDALLVIT